MADGVSKLLSVRKERLGNGVRVLTASRPEVPSAALRVMIKTGSAFEEERHQGIAHFVEHMLFQGTARRPSFGAIGQSVEALGGIINGQTGRLGTTYWVKVLPEHVGDAFDLLSDLLLHSRFEESDIERERAVISEEIHRRQDRPDELVGSLLGRALWPGQSLGRETLGTLETVAALGRDDLLSYLDRQYVSGDIVVAAAGAVEHEQIVALADQYLGKLPAVPAKPMPSGDFGAGPLFELTPRPTAQVHLALGFPAFGQDDPRLYAARLLATVLGRGISSRLFLEVRQRLGLAYSVSAAIHDLVFTGSLQVRAGIKPDGFKEGLAATLRELLRMRREMTVEPELSRAKEMEKARLLFSLESVDAVADSIGSEELLLGRTIPLEDEVAALEATTVGDVQQAARDIFDLERVRVAVVGNVAQEELAEVVDRVSNL